MGKLFSLDSGFVRFLGKVADVIILNFIVILCSFGIVTIGPALVALYYVTLKLVRDEESSLLKDFFKSFKQNFIQGIIVLIVVVLIALFFAYDIYAVYHWVENDGTTFAKIMLGALVGITIIFGCGVLYIFPMVAKFYNTTGKMIKNSLAMGITNLPQTILMVIVTAIVAFLVYVNPYSLMFVIGAWAYFNSLILVKVFDKYIPKKEDDAEAEEVEEGEEVSEEELMHIRLTMDDMNGDMSRLAEDSEEVKEEESK